MTALSTFSACSRKFSNKTISKVVFHLPSNRIFRKLFVNCKQPISLKSQPVDTDMARRKMSIVATPTFSVVRSSTVSLSVSSQLSNTCSNVRQPFQCRINIVNQDMKVPYFSRVIAGGDYFFFRTKRGRLFEGRRLFQIVVTGSRALNIFFLIMPLNQELITSN